MQKIYIPAYDLSAASAGRHGGVRRTEQLTSILAFDRRMFVAAPATLTIETLLCFLVGLIYGCVGVGIKRYVFSSIVVGRFKRYLKLARLDRTNCFVYIEMSTGAQLYLADYLRKEKFAYRVFPHNIEFLVPGQYAWHDPASQVFVKKETQVYQRAKQVSVIGTYDLAIASVFNTNVDIVPYYPGATDCLMFGGVSSARKERVSTQKVLCLGTAHNPPTRIGMEAVIRHFTGGVDVTLVVAGYGTEAFAMHACSSIQVLGGIDSKTFNTLLAEVDLVILYQPPTSGFLTKLVELNLCSVPVLINSSYIQAVGLTDYGIFTYDHLSDIDFGLIRCVSKKFTAPLAI